MNYIDRNGDFVSISTKGRYGLKALMDLAMYANSEVVTIKSISERQDISERYLEQIFSALRKGGLVFGRKGSQGGYVLAKESRDITIGEILRILEGDFLLVEVNKEGNIDELERFINDNLWSCINEKIIEYFDSITLEELVKQYENGKDNIIYFI